MSKISVLGSRLVLNAGYWVQQTPKKTTSFVLGGREERKSAKQLEGGRKKEGEKGGRFAQVGGGFNGGEGEQISSSSSPW